VKVGDLVIHVQDWEKITNKSIGIILDWYDKANDVVMVAWWQNGEMVETNPVYTSRIALLSESSQSQPA
tara:strand:+ start:244 stop:450 length:207 start_codon:yes stop_codon:yes gene_type:complete